MPVSPDLIDLVRLLDEEGFGTLAGELLTEIALGREVDWDDEAETGDSDGTSGAQLSGPERFADMPPPREPIPEGEQLKLAADFVRVRLVEPIRRLAEAESIAGELAGEAPERKEEAGVRRTTDPVRILFKRPPRDDRPPLERAEQAGRADSAEALAVVLKQLALAGG
jgi:hypothetical protein